MLPQSTCTIPDCARPHHGKGWCKTHWFRWYRNGDPLVKTKVIPPPDICTVDDCDQPFMAKGYCNTHYHRLTRGAEILTPIIHLSTEERFFPMVDLDGADGCWLWQGRLLQGYGTFAAFNQNGEYKNQRAHRFSYLMAFDSIPDGLHLDHLCRVRNCVNPMHLEPVTAAVNARRAVLAKKLEKGGGTWTIEYLRNYEKR